MSTTNILDLNNRIDALEKNSGGGGSADSAKRSDIASEFSATTAYTAGCFVYYEGKLYQFNADHAAGAWDPTDVVEANVTDQVVSNASAIAGLTASDVAYDNTDSGLTATDVQGAVDEVKDKIDDLTTGTGWTQIEATGAYYCKVGNVVWVKGHGIISASSWGLIATLPDGYRPTVNIYQCLYVDATHQRSIKIETDGKISMYSDFALDFELSFML